MGKTVAGSIDNTISEGEQVKSKAKKKPANKDHLFPGKLYDLLCDPDSEGIIGWMDHGRSWKILDRERLGAMLERYFKHDHVESFIRSANGWGFKVCRDVFAINIIMLCGPEVHHALSP